jgi:hypothetical protein
MNGPTMPGTLRLAGIERRSPRLARLTATSPLAAIRIVFFVNGALFASWASRIPALSDRAGATPGILGLALLAPAVGAIVAMPTACRSWLPRCCWSDWPTRPSTCR